MGHMTPRSIIIIVIFGLSIVPLTKNCLSEVLATILPTAWGLSAPTGSVKLLGTLPSGLAVSPDGGRFAVLESGIAPPALRVFDVRTLDEVANVRLPGAWGRPYWDPDGRGLWVGTGDENSIVHADLLTPGQPTIDRTIRIAPLKEPWYPGFIERDAKSGLLAVSGESGGAVAIVDPAKGQVLRIVAIDAPNSPIASHPAQLVWNASGSRIYVALWGLSGLAVIDPTRSTAIGRIHTALHPESLASSSDGRFLFVANADDDSLSVVDTFTGRVDQTLQLRLFNQPQRGLQPNDVFLDEKNSRLYVPLAAANAIAVVAINRHAGQVNIRMLGAIPAGWYPTGAVVAGGKLLIVNGKGEQSHANPDYNPYASPTPNGKYDHSVTGASTLGYIADNLVGSLRQVPVPADIDLPTLAKQVQDNAGPMLASAARPVITLATDELDGARVIRANGPIHHVIYVIKENRTYDQVLGDDKKGDGDPSLAIFGRNITPNEHAIADRFGLFDRTFTDSTVSEDGHQWITEAFGNDYVEKTWPPEYAGRRDEDDSEPYATEVGYVWDVAKRAGISYRTYGEFAVEDPRHKSQYIGTLPSLMGHTAPYFAPFDLDIHDLARLHAWEQEFRGYVVKGDLPALETLWLMNDHTYGTRVGKRTPQAFVAENDLAVGRLVQDISHSRYWKDTAIFVIEDDAQNGPDHVDDQRTTMYVASPYARGGLQHHHYTQTGLLRTIELILGLPAMSTYDAAADPLYAAFSSHGNFARYQALPETYDINAINSRTAYGASQSARLNFSHADAANPKILNEILMHAVSQKSPRAEPHFGTVLRTANRSRHQR